MSEAYTFKSFFSEKEISDIQKNPINLFVEYSTCTDFIYRLWLNNFLKVGFPEIPDRLFGILKKSSSKNFDETLHELQNVFDTHKEFKRQARRSRRFGVKMNFGFDLIRPYITQNTKQFLDFGCGKMALLRRLAKENIPIKKLYGFDPASNPGEVNFDTRAEFINTIEKLNGLESLDLIHTSFVFHHLTKREIEESLNILHEVLKNNGIFVFIEESFSTDVTLESVSSQKLKDIGYATHKELTELFEKLTVKERLLAIYMNDVLINLKNLSYMPWTFEYRDLEGWRSIIESRGFTMVEEYSFGIVENDRLKQGLTSMQVFRKKS